MPRTNLLAFDVAALAGYVESIGEKPFRARQLAHWIHQRGAQRFDEMTDLARSLRDRLQEQAEAVAPAGRRHSVSTDRTRTRARIETVFIAEGDRGRVCVFSQAGCAVNCVFCSTGRQGFSRNLETAEIIGQLWMAEHLLRASRTGPGERDR